MTAALLAVKKSEKYSSNYSMTGTETEREFLPKQHNNVLDFFTFPFSI